MGRGTRARSVTSAVPFELFSRGALKIRAKDGTIIPFELNKAQRYLHAKIEEQRARMGRVRAMGLKGRQQGFSTYVQGRFLWRLLPSRGLRAFILTHEQEATNNLFEIAERFVTMAPFEIEVDNSNAKELMLAGQDCGYKVGTAGNKAVGRSSTLQLLHGSEVAYWPNASAHKAGVIQAVPDLMGTEVILESTANGIGGMFYDDWKAVERGDSDFIAIFIPWYWQDEYRRPVPPGFKMTVEEAMLVKRYGLDKEQLSWRRAKIAELKPSDGGNPDDLFKQEYPCNPDEAFLFSGRLVFQSGHLQKALQECYLPKWRAEIESGSVVERGDGRLRIWQKPKPGERYVIGADVAEGVTGGDYSSADVLDLSTGRQVAQWHGHIAPDLYGRLLAAVGKHYNRALIGVERNNHGLTTLTALRDTGYPFIYAQEDLEHRADGKQTKKMGWLTTERSKLKIIDQLSADLRDEDHGIFCKETIEEMSTYIIDENGKYGAKEGCFDDRVMSRAIAGEMLRHAPRGRGGAAGSSGRAPADVSGL